MNIEVEIYISNLKSFFNTNREELYTLIPKGYEDMFFDKIRDYSIGNHEKGEDIYLTKDQMLNICIDINMLHKSKTEDPKTTTATLSIVFSEDSLPYKAIVKVPMFMTKYGEIILN